MNRNEMSVFPNPSSSQITIQIKESADIEIVNAMGEQILKCNCKQELKVDISTWNSGVYFIRNTTDGKVKKFIKE
jgi:hypothetical protein